MIVYRAAWVCPMDQPPIQNGWVAVENGRIVGVGGPSAPFPNTGDRPLPRTESDSPLKKNSGDYPRSDLVARNLGSAVLMPGLVNAHTHLELSWLRGRV
ncbi:MAG: amidohydrolase family protein, partial [Vicinamibacterales bacterium]